MTMHVYNLIVHNEQCHMLINRLLKIGFQAFNNLEFLPNSMKAYGLLTELTTDGVYNTENSFINSSRKL